MAVEFLDAMLAPLRALARRSRPTQEVGAGGTAVYGGYLATRERSAKLVGANRYRTFGDALANNTTISASSRILLRLAAGAPWSIEAAKDSGAAGQEVADFVWDSLHKMRTPWHRVVRRAGTYLLYGFSVQEWTMRRREQDGRLVFADIEPRPQRTIEQWDLDTSGTVHTIIQRSPQTQQSIPLPRWKLIYMVEDSLDDSPEGLGLLRHVAALAEEIRRFEWLEGIGYETDLRGIPIGRVPYTLLDEQVQAGALTPEQRDALVRPMEEFVQAHVRNPELGVVLDSLPYVARGTNGEQYSSTSQFGIELLKSPGEMGHDEVGKAIERKKREAAIVFGTEGILLGGGSTGSLAMSKDKSRTLRELVDSILTDVAETFNRDGVRSLVEMNGWDDDLTPTMRPAAIRHEDVVEVADVLAALANAGASLMPDDPAINVVRRISGLPEVDLDKARADMDEVRALARDQMDREQKDDDEFDDPEDEEA